MLAVDRNRAWVLALFVSLLVSGVFVARARVEPLGVFDQPFYLGIAYDLRHQGRFTDGFVFADGGTEQARPSGMRFAPLYPMLVAALAEIDRNFADGMDCLVVGKGKNESCPRAATLVRRTQCVMLAAIFMLIWHIARRICASREYGWIALALAAMCGGLLARYVNYVMTEISTVFFFTAATATAVEALRRDRAWHWLLLTGILLGLLALTRPAFFYLGLACCVFGFITALAGRGRSRRLVLAGLLALGFALPVAPWIARNAIVVGHAGLTRGYDSHTLVQRISFDRMTWHEYALSYLCWLPDGNGLGRLLIGGEGCDRFGWSGGTDSFYALSGPLLSQTLAESGGWDGHLGYLLRHYVFETPFKHLMVTISFALRGAWINHYWGLVLAPVCLWATIGALRRRNAAMLAVTLPGWFMLAFHAAVAVNQVRYNLVLIPAFSIAGALAFQALLAGFRRRQALASSALTVQPQHELLR